jgi:hypothetical protein
MQLPVAPQFNAASADGSTMKAITVRSTQKPAMRCALDEELLI